MSEGDRSTGDRRVLVTEALAESGLALLRDRFPVDVRPGLAREGLALPRPIQAPMECHDR